MRPPHICGGQEEFQVNGLISVASCNHPNLSWSGQYVTMEPSKSIARSLARSRRIEHAITHLGAPEPRRCSLGRLDKGTIVPQARLVSAANQIKQKLELTRENVPTHQAPLQTLNVITSCSSRCSLSECNESTCFSPPDVYLA